MHILEILCVRIKECNYWLIAQTALDTGGGAPAGSSVTKPTSVTKTDAKVEKPAKADAPTASGSATSKSRKKRKSDDIDQDSKKAKQSNAEVSEGDERKGGTRRTKSYKSKVIDGITYNLCRCAEHVIFAGDYRN